MNKSSLFVLAAGLTLTISPPTFAQYGIAYSERFDTGKAGDPLAVDDGYGSSVAVHGDIGVIGAHTADVGASTPGAAYVIERGPTGTWRVTQRLPSVGAASGDRFGSAVAVAGDRLLVGAPNDDTQAEDSGAVYVFKPSASQPGTWEFSEKRFPSQPLPFRRYGKGLSAAGTRVVVGAYIPCGSGGVEVLEMSGATSALESVIVPAGSHCVDFGNSVALDGDKFATTAVGGAVLYRRNVSNWVFDALVVDPANQLNGSELAFSGSTLAVAKFWEGDEFGSGVVAIYGYDAPSAKWQFRRTIRGPLSLSIREGCGSALALRDTHLAIGCNIMRYIGSPDVTSGGIGFFERDLGGANAWGGWEPMLLETGQQGVFGTNASRISATFSDAGQLLVGNTWGDREGIDAGVTNVYEYPHANGYPEYVQQIPRRDSGTDDRFGFAVARRDDWLFVGSIGENEAATSGGKVFVYKRVDGQWVETQTLLPTTNAHSQYFGGAIVIGDGFAAIGSSGMRDAEGTRRGGVTIFTLQGDHWERTGLIQPLDGDVQGRFGRALALDGNRLAIGSPPYAQQPRQGSIYLYTHAPGDHDHWTLTKRIVHGATSFNRPFGYSLAMRGDVLVGGDGRGTATVFERNAGGADAWGVVTELDAPRVAWTGGHYLATDGEIVVVASSSNYVPDAIGRLYTYLREPSGWQRAQVIEGSPNVGSYYSMLGNGVELSDNLLAVGAVLYGFDDVYTVVSGGYVQFYSRHNNRFSAVARADVRSPPTRMSLVEDYAFAIDGTDIYVGSPIEAGEEAPHPPNVGAWYRFTTESFPLFLDGFE